MCGLTGFWGSGGTTDVERMVATIHHRGPDDTAVYADRDVYLAHARLSIIDLSSTGRQPMSNADGSVTIVFNGEIYNFQKHRERLLRQGYVFRGTSDTEVILALYAEMGERCFSELEGMFAIALWDRHTERMFLVRDRMGKKPLYWGLFGSTLIFGSELKAVLAHPLATREFDPEALALYLAHEYVPTPWTPFKHIRKVRPGSYITYTKKEGVRESSLWDISFLKRTPVPRSPDEYLTTLDGLIRSATEERLMAADVPVGLFLSGGVDSSVVGYYAALLRKEKGMDPLQTFSIGFKEASFDESAHAEQVATHIGATHHARMCTADDALALLPELTAHMDEPFADASLLPTTLLSQFARNQVKVALSGDGGDELFFGYETFLAHRLADYYARVPQGIRRLIAGAAHLLPTSHRYMSLDFRVKRFVRGADMHPLPRNQAWIGSCTPGEIRTMLSPDMDHRTAQFDVLTPDREHYDEVSGDTLRRLSWVYARTYMMDGVLVKVDRASMYASLEVRSPLLSSAVAEFAYGLPSNAKLRGTRGKITLRRLMEGKLPSAIIRRRRKGFGVPLGAWLRGPLEPIMSEKLDRQRIAKQGIFNPATVDLLVREHRDGYADRRKELWTLLMFQFWYDTWYA
jgi:asparagine synthase (glutamine-hydrolysing)